MLWSVGRRTVGANRKANVITAYYGCFQLNRKRGISSQQAGMQKHGSC